MRGLLRKKPFAEKGRAWAMGAFKKAIAVLYVVILLVFTANILFQRSATPAVQTVKSPQSELYWRLTTKQDILALMLAYPQHITGVEKNANGRLTLVLQSGKKILYDDGKSKTFDQKLAAADVQDAMEQAYPLSDVTTLMQGNNDPGRIRSYALLNEVYGSSQSQVQGRLTTVNLSSGTFNFNGNNNAATSLKNAFTEINALIKSKPSVYGFVYPVNGTFNYRCIAGTGQLSAHAYGIGIDLKSNPCDYWRWANQKQGQSRMDAYPKELVRIFENNGFIWGGKWAHFDFLHFEYRPELTIKAKCYTQPDQIKTSWHQGFPDTAQVKACIEVIEKGMGE